MGFGGNGDIPEPGAYFATAGSQAVTEAVWRPSTSSFLIHTPSGGTQIDKFQAGDIPAPGDYDGIGLTEAAVYRPSVGQFFVMGPNDATPRLVSPPSGFGGAGFIPITAPYSFRAPAPASSSSVKIKAASVSLDLGSTAQSLTGTKTTPTPKPSLTPPPAPSPTTVRTRPVQPAAAVKVSPLSLLKAHLAARKG